MGKSNKAMKGERSYRKVSRERARRGFLSATPERLAKSGEPFRAIVTEQNGVTVETQIVTASPLDRLYKAGAFGEDRDLASQRHEAGERYYGHWYHGRLVPLASRDYRKPHIGAGADPYSIAPSQERAEHNRGHFRKAEAALGADRIARVTRLILTDELEPTEAGLATTERKDKAQARAVAVEFLIEGLDRLRAVWGMRV